LWYLLFAVENIAPYYCHYLVNINSESFLDLQQISSFSLPIKPAIDATPSDPPSWSFQSPPYSLSLLGSRFDLTWVYLGGFLLINLKLDIWNGIDVCIVVGRYLKLGLTCYILNKSAIDRIHTDCINWKH
jgi:hypothetical protein